VSSTVRADLGRVHRTSDYGWAGGRGIMSAVTSFEELLYALEGAGLWSDVSEERKRALTQALNSGEDMAWTAGGAWRADGEDLADGDVGAWLAHGRSAKRLRC
jgi:hypothetical protein